jgi:hypothetical protein
VYLGPLHPHFQIRICQTPLLLCRITDVNVFLLKIYEAIFSQRSADLIDIGLVLGESLHDKPEREELALIPFLWSASILRLRAPLGLCFHAIHTVLGLKLSKLLQKLFVFLWCQWTGLMGAHLLRLSIETDVARAISV